MKRITVLEMMCILDRWNISLNENAIQVCLGRVITAPTPPIIQYLWPNNQTSVTEDRIKLFQKKNLTSHSIRKQYIISFNYRSRQYPFTLKMHVRRAVLRLTWQPSTSSWKEPNFQFHSAAVQTNAQWKVSLHSNKFTQSCMWQGGANPANSPIIMGIMLSQVPLNVSKISCPTDRWPKSPVIYLTCITRHRHVLLLYLYRIKHLPEETSTAIRVLTNQQSRKAFLYNIKTENILL